MNQDILVEHRIRTVFELYIVEILKELFKQSRTEAPVKYFEKPTTTKANHCNYVPSSSFLDGESLS